MGKPTFICIGPGRTGTSWLREMLDSHPEVSLSNIKETEYFNNNHEKSKDWYEAHFSAPPDHATGEISNMYYLDEAIPKRIHAAYPSVKIIACTRDPVTLIKSFYQFGVRRGVAAENIELALKEANSKYMGTGFQQRSRAGTLTPGDNVSLIDSVKLEKWLKPYVDIFGKENVLFIPFEKLRTDGEEILEGVYRFLEVDASHKPKTLNEIINPALSPKNKHLALLAHNTAYVLRKIGLNGVLSSLHKSRLIKSMLFKEVEVSKPSPTLNLQESVITTLKDENARIQKLYENDRP